MLNATGAGPTVLTWSLACKS